MIQTILLLAGSYVLGSVPFGLIICKAWKGVDIRNYGSGNIGATNVQRLLGTGPFVIVLLLDAGKGFIPVNLARYLYPDAAWMAVAAGMLAILGHSLSVFLRFKGGRSVATSLGVFLGLAPVAATTALGVWLAVLVITRYVSIASMVASLGLLALVWAMDNPIAFRLFAVLAATLVIARHRPNMVRLMQGKEPRWGERITVAEVNDGKGNRK